MTLVGTCVILTKEEADAVFTGYGTSIKMSLDNMHNADTTEENREKLVQYFENNYPIYKKYLELVHPEIIEKWDKENEHLKRHA